MDEKVIEIGRQRAGREKARAQGGDDQPESPLRRRGRRALLLEDELAEIEVLPVVQVLQ